MPAVVSAPGDKARTGRPSVFSEEERCKRILEAAERVFARVGYGAATMEEMAREAGMSKRTLYAFYADKRELFTAVIGDVEGFSGKRPHVPAAAGRDALIVELHDRLLEMARFVLSERQIRITRLIISEAENHPELAVDFWSRIVVRVQAYLVDGLKELQRADETLREYDANRLASTIFGAILSDLHLRTLFGQQESDEFGSLADRVADALALIGIELPSRQKQAANGPMRKSSGSGGRRRQRNS
ncbi:MULTISPECIES: TetR/AcrR family transcriptional regulator [Pseudomonadota]|nr:MULTISPECIES: TetR/AcrR family transcriptional regulator [Pseudomonadota]